MQFSPVVFQGFRFFPSNVERKVPNLNFLTVESFILLNLSVVLRGERDIFYVPENSMIFRNWCQFYLRTAREKKVLNIRLKISIENFIQGYQLFEKIVGFISNEKIF